MNRIFAIEISPYEPTPTLPVRDEGLMTCECRIRLVGKSFQAAADGGCGAPEIGAGVARLLATFATAGAGASNSLAG